MLPSRGVSIVDVLSCLQVGLLSPPSLPGGSLESKAPFSCDLMNAGVCVSCVCPASPGHACGWQCCLATGGRVLFPWLLCCLACCSYACSVPALGVGTGDDFGRAFW